MYTRAAQAALAIWQSWKSQPHEARHKTLHWNRVPAEQLLRATPCQASFAGLTPKTLCLLQPLLEGLQLLCVKFLLADRQDRTRLDLLIIRSVRKDTCPHCSGYPHLSADPLPGIPKEKEL